MKLNARATAEVVGNATTTICWWTLIAVIVGVPTALYNRSVPGGAR